jgi:AcrR family transcriptional regulator
LEKETQAEKTILNAARKVFIEKGKEGARMQEIADEASINKALLHYYFRSKDRLFDAVFIEAFEKFLPHLHSVILSELSFFDAIRNFISGYINTILENPYIPGFILHELSQNPENIADLLDQRINNMNRLITKIEDEINKGTIRPIDPRQVMVNVIGLCIFPFVARPIIQKIFFQENSTEYEKFLEDRKTEVFNFIYNALKA